MARSKSKQSRFKALQKEAVEKALTEAAYVLIKEKAANKGKIPYDAYNQVIREFGCPSLTMIPSTIAKSSSVVVQYSKYSDWMRCWNAQGVPRRMYVHSGTEIAQKPLIPMWQKWPNS